MELPLKATFSWTIASIKHYPRCLQTSSRLSLYKYSFILRDSAERKQITGVLVRGLNPKICDLEVENDTIIELKMLETRNTSLCKTLLSKTVIFMYNHFSCSIKSRLCLCAHFKHNWHTCNVSVW